MMKKISKYIIVGSLFLGGLSACTDQFDEKNDNVNRASLDQAAPDMLLTNAVEQLSDRVHNIFLGHEMGSCWVQHMAKVQYTDEDRYIPRVSVINAAWSSLYATSGADVALIKSVAQSRGHENYEGVALVLEAYITSVLTDLYGDVPYTEAWQGASEAPIVSPKYDTQESIYEAIIANLKKANELLDPDGQEIKGDILFGNDILKWKKFANSLNLRLLLRRSDRVDPTADMTLIVNDPETYPIFESTDDNAELEYLGSAPNNHPINENRKTRDDHRVSKSLVDVMYAQVTAPEFDYRILAYANPAEASGSLEGLPNGMKSSDAANYLGNGLKNTSTIGDHFTEATNVGVLMSYPELQFILAEAAHKGYISGGEVDAEKYYDEGIASSYLYYADAIAKGIGNYYGVPDDAYVPGSGDGNDPLIWFQEDGGWNYDSSIAMEQIATQKWIAMFDQGLQAWIEWRRLDLPVLTPAVDGVLDGKMPIRVYYPSDEYSRNKANVEAAASKLESDDLLSRVWWDVN